MKNTLLTNWDLNNKKVLITGGTKGIGKAITEVFLNFNAEVFIVSRSESDIRSIQNSYKAKNKKLHGFACDISDASKRKKLFEKVTAFMGGLDILINNVGTNIRKKTIDYTPDEISKIINTNLMSGFELSRLFYHFLKESNEGNIVNISSVAGITHLRTGSIYGITKAAIIQLTKNLAAEWAKDNIRVNTVTPWYINTPLANTVLKNENYLNEVLNRTPLNRIGDPEDVANLVAFLCMPAAKFITGQSINVDGGFSIYGF
ncbi:MAG: SDR family oxidoreductase [Chlorobi bacterium]|nr:SDR family oxidoreductase [Chlorobiota bacterium]